MMIRVLIGLGVLMPVVFGVGCVVSYITHAPVRRLRTTGRQLVLEDRVREQAHANYRLLLWSVRLHQRVLDADATLPIFDDETREQLTTLVRDFYTNETPKELR